MVKSKVYQTLLGVQFILKATTEDEREEQSDYIKSASYANAMGSIMYMMIGIRPNIAHLIGVVSKFMSKPIKEH